MRFLKRLAAGEVALWRAFWLIGIPLALVWDISGECTAVGCGIQDPTMGAVLLALFTAASTAIPFASVAIWRSASRYPRPTRRETLLAVGAKLCAVVSAALAVVGLLVVLYIAFIILYSFVDRAE
jgi:hypothetical protein